MESAARAGSIVVVAQALIGGTEEVWRAFESIVAKHRGQIFSLAYPADSVGVRFVQASDAIALLSAIHDENRSSPKIPPALAELRIVLGSPEAEREITNLLVLAHPGQVLVTAATAVSLRPVIATNAELQALGPHRLRDLQCVEEVFQVSFPGRRQVFPPLRSLDHIPNNLPVQLTSFVGRQEAIAAVAERLSSARLVTLTGAGGSGKTRLALQVGAELLDQYPDGVWLVDLSSLSDPALVAATVAAALQLKEEPGRPTLEVLRAALANRRLLILLDNCEHLITSCAHIANRLLAEAPLFGILATSREPLGIPGEVVWPVPALSIPRDGVWPSQHQLAQYEAVQLFIQRARVVQSSFSLSPQNAPALAAICRRLDGIPLALELAAARTRILSVEQIAERLDDRFRLLTVNARTALPRHQTLRATLDWSYDLLTEQERVLWRRLAVFGGSFSLEAVEGVCAWEPVDPLTVIDLLAYLVDKSLVVAEEQRGVKRYRLLETMRQYARARLADAGEEDQLFCRYCEFYITWTSQLDPSRVGSPDWLTRLEPEHDNIRQAVQWAIDSGRDLYAMRLCAETWFFWMVRGYTSDWSKVLRLVESPALRSDEANWTTLLRAAGALWMHLGQLEKSEEMARRSLMLSRASGDQISIAVSLNNISVVLQNTGRYAEAIEAATEAVTINEALDRQMPAAWTRANLAGAHLAIGQLKEAHDVLVVGLAQQIPLGDRSGEAFSHEYLGLTLMAQGDLKGAQLHLERSLQLREADNDPRGVGASKAGLGELALRLKEWDRAESLLWESVRLRQRAGALASINNSLDTLAWLFAARGEWAKAVRMTGAAEALRRRQGIQRWPIYDRETEQRLAPANQALGVETAQAEFAIGSRLPLEELLKMAEAVPTVVSATAPAAEAPGQQSPLSTHDHPALTTREQEIIKLLAQGQTAREIGAQLFLSPRTVEKHEENIRNKLAVPNRAALVAWAAQRGFA
ncbi:MAG TPA: LuxR C-terminal-related transcriptional regulator [Symbiobacteriaceae bacterium]|nr:LuxR C-terminal-related transcriptional regulator [Symbiobacteriaceae bacterium]